ncbi:hypothetical protein AB0N50_35930 [Streptomyces pharetrae]|uniref:hypothetical protein n=1 Tax=Streptomyces pharetrae TaxID=291370 RepID=UPI00346010F0
MERRNPPLRAIEARARKLFAHEQAWLPIAIQSTELSGKYMSVDKVMLLVRTLLSRANTARSAHRLTVNNRGWSRGVPGGSPSRRHGLRDDRLTQCGRSR